MPLRLGYVKLLQGDAKAAVPLLELAFTKAKSPHDWRTRGRAKLDLARAMLKLDEKAKAKTFLLEAGQQGVGIPAGDDHDALLALLSPAEAAGLVRRTPTPEASPFPLVAGEVKSDQPRQVAPTGFEETMR